MHHITQEVKRDQRCQLYLEAGPRSGVAVWEQETRRSMTASGKMLQGSSGDEERNEDVRILCGWRRW